MEDGHGKHNKDTRRSGVSNLTFLHISFLVDICQIAATMSREKFVLPFNLDIYMPKQAF